MKEQILPSLRRLKQKAKLIKKGQRITHSEALNLVAIEYGYKNWTDVKNTLEDMDVINTPIPDVSLDFVEDEEVSMSEEDFSNLDQERSKDLEPNVKLLVTRNKRQLAKLGIEFSVFEPTLTGLGKSIIDATHPVRLHFELENYHFYRDQEQGNILKKPATLLYSNSKESSTVSLYRPKTKKGDPRMWFTGLRSFASAKDQIAIVIKNGHLYLINLSQSDLSELIVENNNVISNFFTFLTADKNIVANELLNKLKAIAKDPFEGQRAGDTNIGYTLERLLGIAANSSKNPDYKGIEIKSGRSNKTKNRTTLFAQVADWSLSPRKSSSEILHNYGYERNDELRLYCTLSTQQENSQGLSFIYDTENDELQEWYQKEELVAVWPGSLLRKRLKEKHSETFWVEATSTTVNGIETFQLISVIHTQAPITSQLLPLIESGNITMDHLIKRNSKTNRVSEKGPLFKIKKEDLDLLFPSPKKYLLLEEE